jgi:hypothetical protein
MNECLWEKAGSIRKHACKSEHDCLACNFDKSMLKGVEMKKIIHWKEKAKLIQGHPCRYSLTNQIPNRKCGINYKCYKCEFDQSINQR